MAGELTLHAHPTGDLLEATLQCEADVFGEWFGNTRGQLADEYAPYEEANAFVSVTDDLGDVVAMARVLLPNPVGLKTLADVVGPPWELDLQHSLDRCGIDLTSTIDMTTTAVRSGLGGGHRRASSTVMHGILALFEMNDANHVVSFADDRVRSRLDSLGLRFRPLPGTWSAPYLGSPATTPVWTPFPGLIEEQSRTAPDAYRLLALGQGLDGVSLPPRDAFRAAGSAASIDLRDAALQRDAALAGQG